KRRLLERALALGDERLDDGILKLASNVGARRVIELESSRRDDDRRFQAAETEVEPGPIEHRPRKTKAARFPGIRQLRERGAAGVRQPEQLCGLVERFAGRVIDRRADDVVLPEPANFREQGMPARDEQREKRKFGRLALEHRREQMAFEMMYADSRALPGEGEAASNRGADQQCADETRDRKSTRLNSSHVKISYAVFCLKK